MAKYIFLLISCLAGFQALAEQSTEISAYCDDRKLYWVNADTTLRELRNLDKVKKLYINQYVRPERCSADEQSLNYQLARTDGNFVIGAESKFYWVTPQNTVEDIATGKVLLLNPTYLYSFDDAVNVPTKINIAGFLKTAYHSLVTDDLRAYEKNRKQKQLEAHFTNAPRN